MMKKETIIMAFAMGLSLFVSSCNDSEENGIDDARGELVPVVFDSPSISKITRATETEFESGDKLSITAVNKTLTGSDNIEAKNYADNVKYVSNGTEFTAESHPIYQYYKQERCQYELAYYAVFPYKENNRGAQFSFTVNSDQHTHNSFSQSDLSMQKITSKDVTVDLDLKHMLCNVEIVIKGNNLSNTTFSNAQLINMCSSVNADQITQTVTTKESERHDVINCEMMGKTTKEYRFHAIVAPQTIEANQLLATIVINGSAKSLQLVNAVTLKSGCKYVFACNLDGNAVGSNLNVGFGGVDDNGDQIPAARMVSTSEWE